MKVVRPIALVIAVLFLFSQNVYAAESVRSTSKMKETLTVDVNVSPMWINASVVSVDLSFSNGKAQCTGRVTGNIGTTKITATFTLERKNSDGTYSLENSWNESVDGRMLTFGNSHTVSSGYTYRLSVSAKVTKDGFTETVSTYVENVFN